MDASYLRLLSLGLGHITSQPNKMNTSLFKEEVAEQRYKYTWPDGRQLPGPASRLRVEAFPSARFRAGEWNQIHSISLGNEVNTLVTLTSPHCSCKCPKWAAQRDPEITWDGAHFLNSDSPHGG